MRNVFYFSKKVRLFSQNDVLFLFYFLINLAGTTAYSSCSFNGWWTKRSGFHGANEYSQLLHRKMSLYRQWINIYPTLIHYMTLIHTFFYMCLMSFNAIMIVNILLQILFWTLSISCEIYNSSKIDGSSYPHFYNKLLFHFRWTYPRNLTDDNLHSYV